MADAQSVITLGRGMPVEERPCGAEVAKVNRKSPMLQNHKVLL